MLKTLCSLIYLPIRRCVHLHRSMLSTKVYTPLEYKILQLINIVIHVKTSQYLRQKTVIMQWMHQFNILQNILDDLQHIPEKTYTIQIIIEIEKLIQDSGSHYSPQLNRCTLPLRSPNLKANEFPRPRDGYTNFPCSVPSDVIRADISLKSTSYKD